MEEPIVSCGWFSSSFSGSFCCFVLTAILAPFLTILHSSSSREMQRTMLPSNTSAQTDRDRDEDGDDDDEQDDGGGDHDDAELQQPS